MQEPVEDEHEEDMEGNEGTKAGESGSSDFEEDDLDESIATRKGRVTFLWAITVIAMHAIARADCCFGVAPEQVHHWRHTVCSRFVVLWLCS